MGYYLMIKEAVGLDLKYLCKCMDYKDPLKYKGSGVYWRRIIEKHPCEIRTEVLGHYDTAQELRSAGEYYSNLYNIVEDKRWANLIPEIGDGGPTIKGRIGIHNPVTLEEKIVPPETPLPDGWVKGRSPRGPRTKEVIEKTARFHRGRKRSDQTRLNMRNSVRKKRMTILCRECGRSITKQNINKHMRITHNDYT